MTLNNLMEGGSSNAGDLKNPEYPFIAITPMSTLWVVVPYRSPIYESNRTKMYTYAKPICLKKKGFEISTEYLC